MRANPRVLMLVPFPIKDPIFGGQIRAAAIQKKYLDSGIDTHRICMYGPSMLGYESDQDSIKILYNSAFKEYPYSNEVSWCMEDLLTGKTIPKNKEFMQRVFAFLKKNEINIIQLEHPWLYPVVKKIREAGYKFKLVYSSHNNEATLKRSLLEAANSPFAESVFKEIAELENTVCNEADLTFAVTDSDVQLCKSYGAKDPILAPNASYIKKPSPKHILHWEQGIPEIKDSALFIASAFEPNAIGFANLLGPGLGYLSPGQKIFIAGSLAENAFKFLKNQWDSLNRERAVTLGRLSNEDLGALMHLAKVMILPITEGEGSNLKTAEALLHAKYIIGTNKAFRGYEGFKNEPHVSISDRAKEFKSELIKALNKTDNTSELENAINERQRPGSKYHSLTWAGALDELPERIKALI